MSPRHKQVKYGTEIEREGWRRRWSWYIEARNLAPEYGGVWGKCSLEPFQLVKEYNAENPASREKLNCILRGNTQ